MSQCFRLDQHEIYIYRSITLIQMADLLKEKKKERIIDDRNDTDSNFIVMPHL
jgi:hypothetical protein